MGDPFDQREIGVAADRIEGGELVEDGDGGLGKRRHGPDFRVGRYPPANKALATGMTKRWLPSETPRLITNSSLSRET